LWVSVPSGEVRWIDTTENETLTNSTSAPIQLIRLVVGR